MKVRRTLLAPLLALGLGLGCSDDAGGGPDSSVDFGGGGDITVTDTGKPDQAGAPDGAPDSSTPDITVQPDKGPIQTLLDDTHTGWAKTLCTSCHSLPPSVQAIDHSAYTESWQCASCHGGNGACDANGANSSKKDHKATDNCTSCHANTGHGYTAANQCASCHLASAGMVDCP